MIRYILLCFLILHGSLQAQPIDYQHIDFHKADSIAQLYKGEKLTGLPVLAYKLTSSLSSPVEKFRAIYTWVCNNIENDHWAYVKNKKKREKLQKNSQAMTEWNNTFRAQVFKRLLKEKKTVCTGYAYLIKELAYLVDIPCEIIDGYGRTAAIHVTSASSLPNHSWNAVQLDNRWYLCDATWSSGAFSAQENRFIPEYHDAYFLANPELFVMTHYPLDTAWILMKDKPSFDDFLQGPLIYKYAFSYDIIPVQPNTMNVQISRNEAITFLLKAPNSINISDIVLEIYSGDRSNKISPHVIPNQEGLLEIKHTFERIGQYDLHFKIDEKYLLTYVIQVKKK